MRRRRAAAVLLGVALALTGCAGGSARPEATTSEPSPTQPSTVGGATTAPAGAATTATPTCRGATGTPIHGAIPSVRIFNGAGSTAEIDVTVVRGSGPNATVLLDRSVVVAPEERVGVDRELFERPGRYTVSASTGNASATRTVNVTEHWYEHSAVEVDLTTAAGVRIGVVHFDPTPTRPGC